MLVISSFCFLHVFCCDLSMKKNGRIAHDAMLVSFVQLEDVPQAALEPGTSTDQETSKPPERVQSFKHLSLAFLLSSRLSQLV